MFKKGDEVVWLRPNTLELVPGIVMGVHLSGDYPVVISIAGDVRTYSRSGKLSFLDESPTLFHKGTTITLDIAPEPNRLPDLKVDDLVWVWNENKEDKTIRCFSHFTKAGHLHAFNDGYTSNGIHVVTVWWGYYEVYEK